ncbi:tail fiber receptor binding protein [Bacillus phage vB_BcM_Sam112]|uniref:Tail fiber receptor binding protein n=1 Tax=Bacillus phage vB_BcM_Sam112 TaxID=2663324 RepID=A0A5Q2F765_9CAUD|nr:tail fiber receptor binding protein [Bacillus phage vB_BcM_Sam112]
MPFSKELPEWFKSATTPTLTKKNEGWGAGEHPPAALFNWFFNTSYLAIKELQDNAVHKDQKGVANGVASLDGTGDIPIGQADNILNWVKGFGIGDIAKNITSTDVNNLDASGIYRGDNLTNAPVAAGSFTIIQQKVDASYKVQLAIQYSTTSAGSMYVRVCRAGAWEAWKQVAQYDATGKIPATNLPAATATSHGAVALEDAINSNSTTKAATANAVLKLYNVMDGAGIGNFAKDISNSDLNNLDGTGIYRGNNLTNKPGTGPSTEFFYILNMKHAASYKVQIAFRLDNANNQVFKRILSNNVWYPWLEEVAVDQTGTINLRHLPEATTTAEGVTQLNDTTNSNSTTQAATANAVKKVMDVVTGAGVGTDAKDISNTDLNSLNNTGFYKGGTLTNAPDPTSYFFIINQQSDLTRKSQLAAQYNGTNAGRLFSRAQVNGVWTEWVQLATYDDNGKIATANLPDASTSTRGILQLSDSDNYNSLVHAPTSNALKKVRDLVVNAGVGDIAKDISNTDLNVLDGSGFFKGQQLSNSPSGAPSGTWYYIFQMKHAATYKVQTAYRLDNINNQMFKRILSNNVWTPWTEIATTKYVDDTVANVLKVHTDKKDNPHNVTTKQVNLYVPAVNAADSPNNIPDGVTVGTIPPSATGYPKVNGTIVNYRQSANRHIQYWYDLGDSGGNLKQPQYRMGYAGVWSAWFELETTAGSQAKVDATQKFKITKDDGIIKDIGVGIQINAIWTAGIYYVSAAALTNAPVNTVGVLEVNQYNANTAMQTYTVMDPSNPRQFIRYGAGGSWGAWKESATVDKVQVAKITQDNGTDKQAVAAGEDILAKALTWGAGFHTFYAAGNVINSPDATTHFRGYFSKDVGNLGYLFAVDGYGKIHVNRYNSGAWSGWKTSMVTDDATFEGTLHGKVGNNNRGPVAILREGPNATDGFGVAFGSGGYTVLGGGEAAAAILNALAAADVNKESAEVAAENDVFISPGTSTTTPATRKTSIFKASGNVVLPYNSFVNANAGVEQTFPSGVATKIKFNNAPIDHQGEFNTSLARFTAKDAGVYYIKIAGDLSSQVVTSNITFNAYKNGSYAATIISISSGPYITDSIALKLAAGEYLEFYVSASQSAFMPSVNLTIAKIQ